MGSGEGPLTVARARSAVHAGFAALQVHRQRVNDLNVYPVPDGDTGTNLSLTVQSVVEDLRAAEAGLSPAEVCTLITNAALMGARGNSGVILSQMVRGAVEAFSAGEPTGDEALVAALRKAADTSYRAVRKPVEGTMLTVMREVAEAAEQALDLDSRGESLAQAVLQAGWDSVRRTPTLLKVLADAGVVDAGGYGLMVLIEGMIRVSSAGEAPAAEPALELARRADDVGLEPVSTYTYCTSFLVSGEALQAGSLEDALLPLGDSLLVVGTDTQLKVHIHTDDPGLVLTLATSSGVLRSVQIDNMRDQTAAHHERLAELDGPAPVAGPTQVVAVVSGDGVKRLFRSLGASCLVDGGQSMNPSAEELLKAVEGTHASEVLLLPNNSNIIMAAEQVAAMSPIPVVVVPSRSVQAGLSALVVFDPEASAEANREDMLATLEGVVTAEVTRAVRDSRVDGLEITEGSFIGLVDDRAVATGEGITAVLDVVARHLVDDGRELITALVGDGPDAEEAREALEHLRDGYPEVEVEVHEGGQPLYPLLLSAE